MLHTAHRLLKGGPAGREGGKEGAVGRVEDAHLLTWEARFLR